MDVPRALRILILGPPRTKKNHGRIVTGKRVKLLPSEQFAKWNQSAQMQLAKYRASANAKLPLTAPVRVTAHIYRDRATGDAVNYYQAIADALQEGRIILNDSLIVSWDGSRLLKDAVRPRIEMWVVEETA